MYHLLLIGLFVLISANSSIVLGATSKRQLIKKVAICSNLASDHYQVNYDLTFKGESTQLAQALSYFKNTFFVATNFSVRRDPQSFSSTSLLNSKAIGRISESRVSEFKITDSLNSEAYFSSSKELPLGLELNCSNGVRVLSFNEFMSSQEGQDVVKELRQLGCFSGQKPFIVSDQKVYSCNRFFNNSRVITFYFKETPTLTKILTISLSELSDKVGFLQRKVMEHEVKKSLMNVPSIIEGL